MHWKLTTYSEDETLAAGRKLAEQLPPTAVVAVCGDLGAGKTAFIRGVCDFFECGGQVSSPTFTIVNEYDGARSIAHCDLYRLQSTEEMLQIGLDQLFREERVILIEWAERALPMLPLPRFEVAARHTQSAEIREFEMKLLTMDDSMSILFEPQPLIRKVS